MPLAMTMMSGSTSQCWTANSSPVRPKPVWTSSAMSRIPCCAGDLAEARQEARRRDDVAALAEDRLDDHRGDLLGVDELVERQVELGLPVAGAGVRRVGSAGAPGSSTGRRCGRRSPAAARSGRGRRPWRSSAPSSGPSGRGSRSGTRGSTGRPVATRASLTDASTASAPEFDRNAPQPSPGRSSRQPVVEPQARLVVHDVLLAVEELRRLRLDRRDDPRMGVTGVRDADPRRVVEVALAVRS